MQALRSTLGFASKATARKPRVVVLGSGWGGNKVARYLDKSKFDVRVVSPANHFLFTPLLPSTAVWKSNCRRPTPSTRRRLST